MADGLVPTPGARPPAEAPAPGKRAIPRPTEIFDPVARALDVIGDRWSLVLVRHLLLGPKGFQELRVRTGIAPRVLSSRLRDLQADGFVRHEVDGPYAVTDKGRSLEPIVASIARWWTRQGIADLEIDAARFTATSPQSIMESLPFLLREDAARGVDVTFEIRLTGEGGGVWSVTIRDGACLVEPGFADRAQVRYTAEARVWCAMALGLADARDLARQGLLTKEGSAHAMDQFFFQVSRPEASGGGARDTQES